MKKKIDVLCSSQRKHLSGCFFNEVLRFLIFFFQTFFPNFTDLIPVGSFLTIRTLSPKCHNCVIPPPPARNYVLKTIQILT